MNSPDSIRDVTSGITLDPKYNQTSLMKLIRFGEPNKEKPGVLLTGR